MRRRTRAGAAAVIAAVVGVTGCTSGSGSEDDSGDGKQGGGTTAAPAKPGTHASLPEPCGSVSDDALSDLLLVDDQDSGDPEELFKGTAAVTYDIERRVGCEWKSAASLGSHHLKVDFERVVSYDSTVSDDDRASVLYETRARKDEIPAEAPPTEDESGEESDEGEGGDEGDGDGAEGAQPDPNEPTGNGSSTPTPSTPNGTQAPDDESTDATPEASDPSESSDPSDDASSNPGLAPRPLDGIGDVAYLNDELVTADSGLHRDITVVFRAGNVIVTVEYDQWSNDKRLVPGSEELQEKAQKLAKQLAEQLDS